MFEVINFIYDNKERKVLIDKTDSNGDIYGFDVSLLSESERNIVLEAIEIIKASAKTTFRHFKKSKIKTSDNVKKPEEEKVKKFEI